MQSIFVISDLHIGDGARNDNIKNRNRQELLIRFLDHVSACSGRLIIVGDLLELWRCKFNRVMETHGKMLERIAQINPIWILGNHDEELADYIHNDNPPHPLFKHIRSGYECTIAEKKYKFMHGHEVDPFNRQSLNTCVRFIASLMYRFDFTPQSCTVTSDVISDVLLEAGESALKICDYVSNEMRKAAREISMLLGQEQMNRLERGIRTRRMLHRYHKHREEGLYDVAVVGHTHKPALLGNWYYNSGSWTGSKNTFLRIEPDGHTELLQFTCKGEQSIHA